MNPKMKRFFERILLIGLFLLFGGDNTFSEEGENFYDSKNKTIFDAKDKKNYTIVNLKHDAQKRAFFCKNSKMKFYPI